MNRRVNTYRSGVVEIGETHLGGLDKTSGVFLSIEAGTHGGRNSLVHLDRDQWRALKRAGNRLFRRQAERDACA